MRKRCLSFLFSVLVFSTSLFFVIPKIQLLHSNEIQIEQKQAKDLAQFESFFTLMNQIDSENGVSDQENDMVKYVASSKTYYLKQDLDFQLIINEGDASLLYDGTYGVNLVEGSTFNGNNHQILNRYDKDALNNFINANQKAFYVLFNKDNTLESMYFFNEIQNASVMNLTFNNSPFVFSLIGEGNIHNVNMINIFLDGLTIDFNNTINNNQRAISIPLFALKLGSGVNINNSFFNNINIENNTFNITQSTSDPVNVIFSLNGWLLKTNDSSLNTVYSDIEMSNWNIVNNEVTTNNWTTSGFSQSSLMFTPFIINGVRYTSTSWTKDDLSSTFSATPKSAYEVSLFIKNVYMNNFYIANNVKTSSSNSTDNFNISFYPFYNDDDLLNIFYDTILLNNINFEQQTVISEFYKTTSKNTIYINNNLHYLNNIDSQLQTILFDWQADDQSAISDYNYKATKFNPEFWNLSDSNLKLKTDYQFNVDNQIIYENNLPTINVNSMLNNFLPTIFEVDLLKNDEPPTTYDLTDEIDNINFINNANLQADISTIFEETFISNDTVSLHFKLSEANPLLDFTITFNNQTNNSFIYDFENTYNSDTKVLTYEFKLLDPFNQLNEWTLSVYEKNNQLFTVDSNNTSTTKMLDNQTISGEITNINLTNSESLYFVFDLKLNNQTQAIIPGNNLQLGENNYIDSFLTNPNSWFYYYWWVILIVVLILIFMIAIIVGIINAKKQRQKINQIETAMAIWAQDHNDIHAFDDYISQDNFDQSNSEPYEYDDYYNDQNYNHDYDENWNDYDYQNDYLEDQYQDDTNYSYENTWEDDYEN